MSRSDYAEYDRAYNARPEVKARKRAWDKSMRATCPGCGEPMGQGSLRADGSRRRVDVCPACQTKRRVERAVTLIRLRREGLLNTEIAERLGTTRNTVATEFQRLRALGYVGVSPYRGARQRVAAPVITREAEALGRFLRAHGITPDGDLT